jgi:hypothetical protein
LSKKEEIHCPEMSFTYRLGFFYLWDKDSAPSLERVFELAQRAVALNDYLPVAQRVLGDVYLLKRQHEQGIAEMERATTLDPSDALFIWIWEVQ